MAQRAVSARIRVIIGDGPDARDAIPQPQAKLIPPLSIQYRANGQLCLFFLADDRDRDCLFIQGLGNVRKILQTVHRFAAQLHDEIPRQNARLSRRGYLAVFRLDFAHTRHHHAVDGHVDANSPAYRDKVPREGRHLRTAQHHHR